MKWMPIFGVAVSYLAVAVPIRQVCSSIIYMLVNKSMRRKMQKNSTFLEWFGYKRFRLEIPKVHIRMNYIAFWFYLSLLLITIVLVCLNFLSDEVWRVIFACTVFPSVIFGQLYHAYFLGVHWTWTWLNRPEKCKIRGIDKKKYMEVRRKQRQSGQGQGNAGDG